MILQWYIEHDTQGGAGEGCCTMFSANYLGISTFRLNAINYEVNL